jgi:hypothetical protein
MHAWLIYHHAFVRLTYFSAPAIMHATFDPDAHVYIPREPMVVLSPSTTTFQHFESLHLCLRTTRCANSSLR